VAVFLSVEIEQEFQRLKALKTSAGETLHKARLARHGLIHTYCAARDI
jgi:hypothetical protein